jgi:hypothetical protein
MSMTTHRVREPYARDHLSHSRGQQGLDNEALQLKKTINNPTDSLLHAPAGSWLAASAS